jgi:hypothetical protein
MLDALTKVGKLTFDAALKAGAINPDMEHGDLEKLIPEEQRHQLRAAASLATREEEASEEVNGSEVGCGLLPAHEPKALRFLLSDLAGLVADDDPAAFAQQCSSEKREMLKEQLGTLSEWIVRVLRELEREEE